MSKKASFFKSPIDIMTLPFSSSRATHLLGQEEGNQSRFHLLSLCASQNIYFLEYVLILMEKTIRSMRHIPTMNLKS